MRFDDVRVKAVRTSSESVYLAWLISQLPAQTPVTILGHSFGARIGTGALHLLGGGRLNNYALPVSTTPRTPARAIFTAAALHNNWLLPHAQHGCALDAVSSAVFLNNSCDPALKHYRLVDCTKPNAAGYRGALVDAGRRHKVRQLDACPCNGKTHDAEPYFYAGSLLAEMRRMVAVAPLSQANGSATSATATTEETIETERDASTELETASLQTSDEDENEACEVEEELEKLVAAIKISL
ncbi:MAG: hypothetical protein QM811_05150 [Pirellulales bacterium]